MNREAWLQAAADKGLHELIQPFVGTMPQVRVSVGWPSKGGLARKSRKVGQCWAPEAAQDKMPHIFVSPLLAEEITVLGVLVHEMIHAGVGLRQKHGKMFKTVHEAVGLTGKATASEVGPDLRLKLEAIARDLGAYPHAALDPMLRPDKKQTTRMLKSECGKCGYTVRLTKKWLDLSGTPLCPGRECKQRAMNLQEPEGEEGR